MVNIFPKVFIGNSSMKVCVQTDFDNEKSLQIEDIISERKRVGGQNNYENE